MASGGGRAWNNDRRQSSVVVEKLFGPAFLPFAGSFLFVAKECIVDCTINSSIDRIFRDIACDFGAVLRNLAATVSPELAESIRPMLSHFCTAGDKKCADSSEQLASHITPLELSGDSQWRHSRETLLANQGRTRCDIEH
jgi:hypothetical protein